VGVVAGYGQEDRFSTGARVFSLLHTVQTGLGPTQPPIQRVPGALSRGGGGGKVARA
jgi:hypothetical protein